MELLKFEYERLVQKYKEENSIPQDQVLTTEQYSDMMYCIKNLNRLYTDPKFTQKHYEAEEVRRKQKYLDKMAMKSLQPVLKVSTFEKRVEIYKQLLNITTTSEEKVLRWILERDRVSILLHSIEEIRTQGNFVKLKVFTNKSSVNCSVLSERILRGDYSELSMKVN